MARYLFRKEKLINNISKLTNAFKNEHSNFQIFYSVKTNFSKPVLNSIHKHCRFEIVSAFEWEMVKKYKPTILVLNGPSKSIDLVKNIINSGVEQLFFNIDNDTDIALIQNLEKKYKDKMLIGLRLYLNKPGIWNRFGYDISSSRIKDILSQIGNQLQGFHFHFSTNNFSIDNYSAILNEINDLIAMYKLNIKYIDIGGGLPGADEIIYEKQMYQELPKLIKKLTQKNILIISEVGRNLVENAFDLETKIVSQKRLDNGTIDIVIDINIMHFPCFWEKKYTIEYSNKNVNKEPVFINIFGNSCMQVDKIAENYLINFLPKIGDTLLLLKVGAYSLSQASNFITKIPTIDS